MNIVMAMAHCRAIDRDLPVMEANEDMTQRASLCDGGSRGGQQRVGASAPEAARVETRERRRFSPSRFRVWGNEMWVFVSKLFLRLFQNLHRA